MTVGLLAAYQPIGALALAIAPMIAAIALYRLPIAVAHVDPADVHRGAARLAAGAGAVRPVRRHRLGRGAAARARSTAPSSDARNLLFGAGGDAQLVRALAALGARPQRRRPGTRWYFIEVAIFLLIIATVPRDAEHGQAVLRDVRRRRGDLRRSIGAAGVLRGDAAVEQGIAPAGRRRRPELLRRRADARDRDRDRTGARGGDARRALLVAGGDAPADLRRRGEPVARRARRRRRHGDRRRCSCSRASASRSSSASSRSSASGRSTS